MKKIISLLGVLVLGFLVWYFFINPHDYSVTFNSKTSPGTLSSGVEQWNLFKQKKDSISYEIKNKNPYTSIDQTLNIDGISLDLAWKFKSINDTTTHDSVGFTEKGRSIYNRITIPFSNTKLEEISLNAIKHFKKGVDEQIKNKFKVKFIGIDTIPEIAYAYIDFKDIDMSEKAEQMMTYNARLLQFITQTKIKDGIHPFLLVNNWDLNKNKIDFRFCFPIRLSDSMPSHEYIKFDVLKPIKSLKAMYNGNYMTSDRG
ncbi:MAG: hypothetical protein JKZ03_07160, partial [Flavobacteriaceae bacterium]|nr:hypothetical protein [Flavobacteriaceae bacterium]